MTHFRDLELVHYHDGAHSADYWQCPLLAIGWLEQDQEFAKGRCSPLVTEKIAELRPQFREAFPEEFFRGHHQCSLCNVDENFLLDSHLNLFVPGENVVYLATGRVDHHINAHAYLPPAEFIDALLVCPDPRTEKYAAALFKANRGIRPVLFPERWHIYSSDSEGNRVCVGDRDSESNARQAADAYSARVQGKTFEVEKAPDIWPGLFG